MIRPSYAIKLAKTKLKTKKLLLIVTIGISALVFGVITAGILMATGVSRSTDSYLRTALNEQYLVSTSPVIPNEVYGYGSMGETPSDDLKAHLLNLQKQYINEQEKLAAEYGTTFNVDMLDPVLKPDPFGNKDTLGNVKEVINRQSPVYQQLYVAELQDKWLASTNATIADLKKAADAKGATAYYQNRNASISYVDTFYLPGGKEDLNKVVNPDIPSFDAVQSSIYMFTDQTLVERYVLPENQARQDNTSAIPVIITKEEAIKLFGDKLGLTSEPNSPAEKIAWMKALQEKINGHTYQACYRNSSEVGLIQEAMRQNQTTNREDDAEIPTVTYKLPTSVCSPVTIEKDNRTEAQKTADARYETYQKATVAHSQPITQLLTFQVVGIMPAPAAYANLDNLPALVDSLLSSQYQSGAFIPRQLYEKLSETDQHKDILQSSVDSFGLSSKRFIEAGVVPTIISFSSAADAKSFIDTYTCPGYDQGGCKKPWMSQVYGAMNYRLVDDIGERVAGIARLVLPIAAVVAIIIMSFTMTRVIIDSRHETAVFRALGAKRRDIASIYLTYSALVASLVAVCSLILGFIVALVVQILYRNDVADYAKVAYGVFNEPDTFSFIGVDSILLSLIVAVVLAVGFIAVVPPLIRNVRRSPIRDMRDD